MFFILLIAITIGIFLYVNWTCSYWIRKQIDGPKPIPIFGNMLQYAVMKKHFGEVFADIYRAYPNAAFVGIHKLMNEPAILVRDLDIIKDVMVKNFNNFHDNGFTVDEVVDPLMAQNPFGAKGEKWKYARTQVAPLFTAGKVRSLLPLMSGVCDKFVKYISENPRDFETKELCSKYTLEVVGSCGFGLEAQMFTNPDSDFRKMTDKVFKPDKWTLVRTIGVLFLPRLSKFLQIAFISKEVDQWMRSLAGEVVKMRQTNAEKRNDLLQTMLDMREKNKEYSELRIAGYSLAILTEGFETSSTLMAYSLYALASNPDVQELAQEEIDRMLEKHNGKLSDDLIQELQYLDGVMHETLRIFTPVLAFTKICTTSYELPLQYPDSKNKITIHPGTSIIVPAFAIHNDPNIYSDPTKFDPTRFVGENKKQHNKYAFLAFGEGPRICIGQRFALTQSKAGIASILANFNIKLSPKTKHPLPISKTAILLACEPGIWVNFESRKHKTM